jgi:hypothetical protein
MNSGRYTLEQREIIIEIKNIMADVLKISNAQAQLISVDQNILEMMKSYVSVMFIEKIRTHFDIELCWGRIANNPTIDTILEVILEEKEDGYKCNSGKKDN